jgi:hypothetical protein
MGRKIMPKFYIQALNIGMTEEEAKQALSSEAFAKIKGKKAVAYVIGEEGNSHPRVIGEGHKLLRWPRAVIKRLAENVKAGTKFFDRHNKDNSHEGRVSLGEIVGSFTRMVGDKLQAIAIGVLEQARPDLDICSVEAEVHVNDDGLVGDVEEVSGVALSSSNVDSPAFPGAQRLAVLQCFDQPADTSGEHKDSRETGKPGEGDEKMEVKMEDVKAFIRDHNVFPRQLFNIEDLKNDREFGPVLKEGVDAKAELLATKTKLETVEKASTEAIRKASEASAKDQFEKLIPTGATPKQKAFYLKRFDPSKLEKLDEVSLKAYIENEAKEYADYAKTFGVIEEPPVGDASKDKAGAGVDPVESALNETIGGKPNA